MRLIELSRNDAGLIAEQIIGDEVQGGCGFFVGDRRTDPCKADAIYRSGGRGGRWRLRERGVIGRIHVAQRVHR